MEGKHITKPTKRAYPACCDIFENEGAIILQLEMPGIVKDDLAINVDGDLLTIHARKNLYQKSEGKFLIKEIRDSDYHHEFTIDSTIDRGKIDAELKKGILTLTLHIKETEKPRKIQVVAK